MKKKIGSLIMAIVMVCTMMFGVTSLTACNNAGRRIAEFEMPEGGFDTEKTVEISFDHTMGKAYREVLQKYIKKFQKLYPNIKVNEEQAGDYDTVRDQIATQIQGGEQPNIAYCYPDHVALFNKSGAVLPLNDFLYDGAFKDVVITRADGLTEQLCMTKEQKDSFIDSYYDEGYMFDDGSKMYTLPFAKSTEVLFYNKTFFEQNGLTVPTTWDEMEETCKRIKELDPTCDRPLGYDSEANWFITMCEQYGSEYTSADGEKFRFDNETNRAFVQKFKGWYDKKYFTTQRIYGKYTSNLFKEKRAYMCIGSSAGATNQRPERKDGVYPFEVGIAPIPQVHPENPKVISQGPSVCIFKDNDPQKVLASWLLVKYLTTNLNFQAEFSSASGYIPVLETIESNEIYQADMAAADGGDKIAFLSVKVAMQSKNAYYTSPAFVGSTEARDQVGLLMQAVFTDAKSIDRAFKDAIAECKRKTGN